MSDAPPAAHPEWSVFVSRHAGNPFLSHDPLYALDEDLIEAISSGLPEFFSATQRRFERDLAQTASFGFFLQRPLGRVRQPSGSDGKQSANEQSNPATQQIQEMLAEQMRRAGADAEDTSAFFELGREHRRVIEARQEGYAGWLILDPVFRDEVQQFREKWGGAIAAIGRFPRLPLWMVPDVTDNIETPAGFRDECYQFYCRWGLDTFLTWDWPVPMEPDLDAGLRQNNNLLSSAGMLVFIPWYMTRGEKLDLSEVVRRSRLASAPDHLLDWVSNRPGQLTDGMDDGRLATARWLYRHYELVLMRRYADACQGNFHRLDIAFAKVLKRSEDTIKKVRLVLWQSIGRSNSGQPAG